jgi:RNA polymerase subunit RPABC4/transcription elongation factor Spt4
MVAGGLDNRPIGLLVAPQMCFVIPCPSCKTLVTRDMAECPRCGQVLEKKSREAEAASPIAADGRPAEIPCRECGEMIRVGLVRCWNCGTFIR